MKLKPALLAVALVGAIALAAQVMQKTGLENNAANEAAILKGLFAKLNRFHYQPRTLDDKFSEQVYNLYLEDIDNGRRFLTQQDIDKLAPFKKEIDDQANARSIVVEADAKHAFVFAGAAFAERLDLALIHQAPERG